jgi:hypothetical protein
MARSRPLLALFAVLAALLAVSQALPWPADGFSWKAASVSRLPSLKAWMATKKDCKTVYNVRLRAQAAQQASGRLQSLHRSHESSVPCCCACSLALTLTRAPRGRLSSRATT